MMFNLATFCHYYVAYMPKYKAHRLMLADVGKINGIPAIGGI